MNDLYENLEMLCETVADEIGEANDKIKAAGGKISQSDIGYLDKLTHMLKSIKTTKAMMEAEGASYSDNPSYPNASYARGRSARRDSMGRYSSRSSYGYMPHEGRVYNGYAYDSNMVMELKELMEEAPNAQIRQKFQQLITEVENMK